MSKQSTSTHSGTAPSGSYTLPDPTLINDLRQLAASLGYTQGERGNVSGLIAALAVAARKDQAVAAERLRFIAKKA